MFINCYGYQEIGIRLKVQNLPDKNIHRGSHKVTYRLVVFFMCVGCWAEVLGSSLPVRQPCMSREPFWRVPRGCWSVSSSTTSSTRCPGNNMGPRVVAVSPRHLCNQANSHSIPFVVTLQSTIYIILLGYQFGPYKMTCQFLHNGHTCLIFAVVCRGLT